MKFVTKIRNVEKIAQRLARKEVGKMKARNARAIKRMAVKLDDSCLVNSRGWL